MKPQAQSEFILPDGDYASEAFDTDHQVERNHLVLIYSTPRSGSTWLCSLFHEAGICTPHEYFQPAQYRPALQRRWGAREGDDTAFAQKLVQKRIGPRGTLGVNLHATHIHDWLRAAPNFGDFRKVSHIFLWRSNQISQAVSYFIANETRQWSAAFGPVTQYPTYDIDRIQRRLSLLNASEDILKRHAAEIGDQGVHLNYETLVKDPDLLRAALPDLFAKPLQRGEKRPKDAVKNLYCAVFSEHRKASWINRKRLASRTKVCIVPTAHANPYQEMMYRAADGWLETSFQTKMKRLQPTALVPNGAKLIHLHWEEGLFWSSATKTVLEKRLNRFQRTIEKHKARGGRILWTLHNDVPHMDGERAELAQRARSFVVDQADAIHVHSEAGRDFAIQQLKAPDEKVFKVEHPSYADVYEKFSETVTHKKVGSARFLFFGRIEPYKGVGDLIEAFHDPRLLSATEVLTVAGKATPEHLEVLRAQAANLQDRLFLRPGHVADADVPQLFKSADFIVLPYSHGLTSGVAALAMTFGVPIVGRDLPEMREAVPEENHPLLYGDPSELKDHLLRAAMLDPVDHQTLRTAAYRLATRHAPYQQSAKLLNALLDRGMITLSRNSNWGS